jgi:hypothetical protein
MNKGGLRVADWGIGKAHSIKIYDLLELTTTDYDIILAFYNTLFISLVIILATTRNYNANFK